MKRALLIALSALLLLAITTEARPDLCELPKVVGPCRAAMKSWYYDPSVGSCVRFIYGGCGGNDNRFHKLSDCEATCANDDGAVNVASYSQSASSAQSGYITKYECTDYTCATCRVVSRDKTDFGTCERDGSNYQKNECYGGSFLMSDTFDNAKCDGKPDTTIISGTCDNQGDFIDEVWIKYDCYVSYFGSSADEEQASGNMNVSIVVAVLSIVAVIGMIGGCLVYRHRKKSAELLLLDNDTDGSKIAL